ncbi:unnamed protein product [Ectocarpus fasciculatus]
MMLSCVRATRATRALSQAARPRPRYPRPHARRPLPSSCAYVVRLFSADDRRSGAGSSADHASSGSGSSSSSVDGSSLPSEAVAPVGSAQAAAGFDPTALIPPPPPPPAAEAMAAGSGAEPLSTAAGQFVADFPSSVAPLMTDAGMYLLKGALAAGMHVIGGVQSGVQAVHHTTGLPWWATIAVATIGVKVSLLPVVVYQAGHMDRMRMAWPEIQTLRSYLATTLEEIPQQRVLERWRKYKVFFSGARGVLGMHGTHIRGLFATPLVNLPVFITFVWSIRGMLRDGTVPGLDTGGMLWFVDLTVPDSSLMLPIIGTLCTYTSLEIVKMKGATGWIKFFQDGMQTLIILMLPWISTFPQGVFMYWIPSSAFQMGQTYTMKNNKVRELLGLKPLGPPPREAAGATPPPPPPPVPVPASTPKAIAD